MVYCSEWHAEGQVISELELIATVSLKDEDCSGATVVAVVVSGLR